MNSSGLPQSPRDDDEYLASFDKVMDIVSNVVLAVGLTCFVIVAAFVWGYFVS